MEKMELKPGQTKIDLKNLDGIAIGEYLITDGNTHTVFGPYSPDGKEIDQSQLRAILRDHANMSLADLAVVLLS